MIKSDLYPYFDYIGRVETVDFYRKCNLCKTIVKDKPSAMAYHLKNLHPEKHKAWYEYKKR